jgi:hypothetical protein
MDNVAQLHLSIFQIAKVYRFSWTGCSEKSTVYVITAVISYAPCPFDRLVGELPWSKDFVLGVVRSLVKKIQRPDWRAFS